MILSLLYLTTPVYAADDLNSLPDGPFAFIASWERVMKGDELIRSQRNPQDSYRIQKAAFECTYEILTPAG